MEVFYHKTGYNYGIEGANKYYREQQKNRGFLQVKNWALVAREYGANNQLSKG